jgi:cell division protein FtsQ
MKKAKRRHRRGSRRQSVVLSWLRLYASAIVWGLAWSFFLVGVVYSTWRLSWSPYFNVSHVSVSGHFDQLGAAQLQDLLRLRLRGNLFRVPIVKLSKALKSVPWVKSVSIQRIWPNQIRVYIEQRQAAARFNKRLLLDQSGQLFEPAFIPAENYWHLWGKREDAGMMLQQAKRFQSRLLVIHWEIQSVYLNNLGLWRIVCHNKAQIMLGEDNMINKLSLFVQSFSKASTADSVKQRVPYYIDLRYPNGFSIQWKDKKPSITS